MTYPSGSFDNEKRPSQLCHNPRATLLEDAQHDDGSGHQDWPAADHRRLAVTKSAAVS